MHGLLHAAARGALADPNTFPYPSPNPNPDPNPSPNPNLNPNPDPNPNTNTNPSPSPNPNPNPNEARAACDALLRGAFVRRYCGDGGASDSPAEHALHLAAASGRRLGEWLRATWPQAVQPGMV